MNYYIKAQIFNIKSMVKVFEQSCKIAAQKDNEEISKDEEKQLKQIKAAAEKFCKDREWEYEILPYIDEFKGNIVKMVYLGRDNSADWDTYETR